MIYIILCITLVPFTAGLTALLLNRQRPEKKRCILIHNIYRDKKIPAHLSEISRSQFRTLLQTVVPYRRITSIRDYSGGADIALTFDDGFFSIASMAAPLLEEHHCSATLFIITNTLSGGPVYDVYKNKKKLSPADLKDLSQRGFEIGSHTTSHRDLRQLSTSQCRYELEKSKGDLEDIINREVVSLSFPLGLWNRRVIRCAETAGYRNFSLYNGHGRGKKLSQNIFFAQGVYPFDTKGDMYKKFVLQTGFSSAFARSRILPHFAKGTAMVHTCEEYHPLRISPEVWSPFFSDAEQEKRTAHKKYKNR